MRNIFITKKQYELLKEEINKKDLPLDVASLGGENICDFISNKLKKKLLSVRYNKILNILQKLNLNKNNSVSKLEKLIVKKEEGIKEQLEHLCAKSISELFNIPSDLISFSCNLINELNNSNTKFLVSPIEDDDDFEYNDISQVDSLTEEIQKRITLNALIIGGANILTKNVLSEIKSELDNLNPDLYNLYNQLLWLNEINLFNKEVKPTDENPQLGGNVVITLGNENTKTKIESKALVFPILIFESIKGFLDLFISHGLPKNENEVKFVLQRSDCLEYEQFSLLFGSIMWNLVMNSTGNDKIDSQEIPFLLEKISRINSFDLCELFSEILYKTKKGKEEMKDIINSIHNEIEYNDFEDRLSIKREKTLVMDDYFSSDELLDNNIEE